MAKSLKKQARRLAKKGRRGDTHLLHITREELMSLLGTGKVTRNPHTGLPEAAAFMGEDRGGGYRTGGDTAGPERTGPDFAYGSPIWGSSLWNATNDPIHERGLEWMRAGGIAALAARNNAGGPQTSGVQLDSSA